MGLDTSHDCWHGAYSAFYRWRNEVALAAGYEVAKIDWGTDDLGDGVMQQPLIEWHRATDETLSGDWTGAEAPPSPLYFLFIHSDYDGEIRPREGPPLADALEALLPRLAERERDTEQGGHIAARGGLVAVTEKFIAGLRAAAAAGEPVEFH